MKANNTTERKPIRGHRNFEIDENGKVWDVTTNTKVKEYINPAGFSYVVIDRRIHTVAYLMKSAFFNDDAMCIRHKDGDRTNNRLDNLYTHFSGEETLDGNGEERKSLVMEVDPDNNEVIKIWGNVNQVAEHYNLNYNTLRARIRKGKIYEGVKVEVFNPALDEVGMFDYTDGNHKLIIFWNDNIVDKVTTITEARRRTGEGRGAIEIAIANQTQTVKGYRYKWELSTTPEPTAPEKPRKETLPKQPKTETNTYYGTKNIRIDVYDLNGNFIGNYPSVSEAERAIGVCHGGFWKILHGSTSRCGGYTIRQEGEPFTKYKQPQSKQFYQLTKAEDGNGFIIVKEWQSVRSAIKGLGLPSGTLYRYLSSNPHAEQPFKDGYYYAYGSW